MTNQSAAFRRLASDLREQIVSRTFPEDVPLPTEAELARSRGVSRQTVRRAFQEIVAEGLVYRVPGKGTFATPPTGYYLRQHGSIEDLMALSRDSELKVLRPLGDLIAPVEARRLGLDEDRVGSMTFLRLYENQPFCATEVFLTPAVASLIPADSTLRVEGAIERQTVIGTLKTLLHDPIESADQSISVADPRFEVNQLLGLSAGRATLRIDRLYTGRSGNPIELAITHFHPDRYSYRVRLEHTAN